MCYISLPVVIISAISVLVLLLCNTAHLNQSGKYTYQLLEF